MVLYQLYLGNGNKRIQEAKIKAVILPGSDFASHVCKYCNPLCWDKFKKVKKRSRTSKTGRSFASGSYGIARTGQKELTVNGLTVHVVSDERGLKWNGERVRDSRQVGSNFYTFRILGCPLNLLVVACFFA